MIHESGIIGGIVHGEMTNLGRTSQKIGLDEEQTVTFSMIAAFSQMSKIIRASLWPL